MFNLLNMVVDVCFSFFMEDFMFCDYDYGFIGMYGMFCGSLFFLLLGKIIRG